MRKTSSASPTGARFHKVSIVGQPVLIAREKASLYLTLLRAGSHCAVFNRLLPFD